MQFFYVQIPFKKTNNINNKIMKTRISSILFLTAILISNVTFAQRPSANQNRQERQDRGRQFEAREDFLTDEQKEAVKKLRLETEKEIKPLRNELREAMAKQQTLTTADNADLKAINSNIDKMAKIKAEMQKVKAKQHQAFRAQLTEEQLIKFDSRKNKMHQGKNRQKGNRADGKGYPANRRG